MRQIVLDTETTGLDPALGHRIIELAAVEVVSRRLTGAHFHHYFNPEREVDPGALQVHGITNEFLQDKPRFGDLARELLDYVQGAELVIHNAAFDIAFLNHELELIGLEPIERYCPVVTDTLKMAKELHPGQKNSLDALCKRYQVDYSERTLHGALLDAQLLADVYLAMTRGQESLAMDVDARRGAGSVADTAAARPGIAVLLADAQEQAAHRQLLADIERASQSGCLWTILDCNGDS